MGPLSDTFLRRCLVDIFEWPRQWEFALAHDPERVGRRQQRNGREFNRVIVVHTTENSLLRSSAEQVAKWQNTQRGTVGGGARRYSGYHFLVDRKGVVGQCNPDTTRAFHAGESWSWRDDKGGGNDHIGLALVARAHKWPYEDSDEDKAASRAMLGNAAAVVALLQQKYGIPSDRLTIGQYRLGDSGLLGHSDVATPAGRKSDPGEHFPWDEFLSLCKAARKRRTLNDRAERVAASASVKPVVSAPAPLEWGADEEQWLKAFLDECRRAAVEPSSLAYLVKAARAERSALGVEDSAGPATYGTYKGKLLRQAFDHTKPSEHPS